MSALSRLSPDARRAVVDGRWAREEEKRRRIRDARPVTRSQMIADITRGLQTAEMIAGDVHHCRRRDLSNPSDTVRWARDQMDEPHKLSMLRAIVDDVRELLDALGTGADRRVMS